MNKEKIKSMLKKIISFLLNPHFLICFGAGWMVTNGWAYIGFALGTVFDIHWLLVVSGTYLTYLWLPISPEKLVTFALAIFLMKKLFPNDEKTLGMLEHLLKKCKEAVREKKELAKEKRAAKKAARRNKED